MEQLFSTGDLRATLDRQVDVVQSAIDELSRDEILSVSEEDLVGHLLSRFAVEPLVLDRDAVHIEEEEIKIEGAGDPWHDLFDEHRRVQFPGTKLTVVVPFSGESALLRMRANQWSSGIPYARIGKTEFQIIYTEREINAAAMRSRIDKDLGQIEHWIKFQDDQINDFNNQLEPRARQWIAQRRERLLKAEGAVAAIGLPVRRRQDAPSTYPVPGVRRKPKRVKARPAPSDAFTPEFAIDDGQYDDILATIAQMTDVIERSPHAFATLDEEALRTHLLVPLNSAFEGGASAETFNYEGKTDILIRHEGKVVFVAECKIWKGAKTLAGAVQQLRGYLSWRDTKTAVILFVRNRDFSSIVKKVVPTVENAEGWKRTQGQTAETTFRFIFGHRDDSNREILLSVVLLAVPSPETLADAPE